MTAFPLTCSGGTALAYQCAQIDDVEQFQNPQSFYAWAAPNSNGFATLTDATECNAVCNAGLTTACSNLAPNVNNPQCTQCFECVTARQTVTRNGQVLLTCPATATTTAAIWECFEIAACAGLIQPTDQCTNNVAAVTVSCPFWPAVCRIAAFFPRCELGHKSCSFLNRVPCVSPLLPALSRARV